MPAPPPRAVRIRVLRFLVLERAILVLHRGPLLGELGRCESPPKDLPSVQAPERAMEMSEATAWGGCWSKNPR